MLRMELYFLRKYQLFFGENGLSTNFHLIEIIVGQFSVVLHIPGFWGNLKVASAIEAFIWFYHSSLFHFLLFQWFLLRVRARFVFVVYLWSLLKLDSVFGVQRFEFTQDKAHKISTKSWAGSRVLSCLPRVNSLTCAVPGRQKLWKGCISVV